MLRISESPAHVACAMQDAPDVEVIVTLDIEDEPVVPLHPDRTKTGQTQLMRPARRADAGIIGDRADCALHRIDEAKRDILPRFTCEPIDSTLKIAPRQFAQDGTFARHGSGKARAQIVEESLVRNRPGR